MAQKPPFYIASGFWHSGLQIYNPTTDEWHWGSMSDGNIGEIFFLNNEVFTKATQLYQVNTIKGYEQFLSVNSGGGETIGSENITGRAYGIKRTAGNEQLIYTNNDYTSGYVAIPSINFPLYSSIPIAIPNEPDKLVVRMLNGNDKKLFFYSGCNQPTPSIVLDHVVDLNLVYDPSGQSQSDFRKIIFDLEEMASIG